MKYILPLPPLEVDIQKKEVVFTAEITKIISITRQKQHPGCLESHQILQISFEEYINHVDNRRVIRGLSHITSAHFGRFLTSSPLVSSFTL